MGPVTGMRETGTGTKIGPGLGIATGTAAGMRVATETPTDVTAGQTVIVAMIETGIPTEDIRTTTGLIETGGRRRTTAQSGDMTT